MVKPEVIYYIYIKNDMVSIYKELVTYNVHRSCEADGELGEGHHVH